MSEQGCQLIYNLSYYSIGTSFTIPFKLKKKLNIT